MYIDEKDRLTLRQASDLYARLLEYAMSPPFRERAEANVRRLRAMGGHDHGTGLCVRHQSGRAECLGVEQIVFDGPPYGLRLIDRFAEWSADLGEHDRNLLDGWREGDMFSVFEVLRRVGAGFQARNLGTDLVHVLHIDPRSPMRREDLRTGRYVVGHALPTGDSWMLAGVVEVHAAHHRRAMLGTAAELVRSAPALPFRNPVILEAAYAAVRRDHGVFLDVFGGQGVARTAAHVVELLDRFWAPAGFGDPWWPSLALERDLSELRDGMAGTGAERRTFHPVHDPIQGLRVLDHDYGTLARLHRAVTPVDAQAVRDVGAALRAERLPDFAVRGLAERYPARASEIFDAVLERPGFVWQEDGPAWLRERFGAAPELPGLVWLPGGATPAGSGKLDRVVAGPRPVVVSFPSMPTIT
ncbi:hypothetical protein AB1046_05610 [Promicromonospora sp. Populi]|uniref:hypothetical protein n=1 Tax=Promicromonospora sp. Populi TaxID=3239420 RepID=UPI0034E2F4CB